MLVLKKNINNLPHMSNVRLKNHHHFYYFRRTREILIVKIILAVLRISIDLHRIHNSQNSVSYRLKGYSMKILHGFLLLYHLYSTYNMVYILNLGLQSNKNSSNKIYCIKIRVFFHFW